MMIARACRQMLTIGVAAAALCMLPGGGATAQLPNPVWSYQLDDSDSLFGSYLAGRIARGARDASVAADYYRNALARDPGNPTILEEAFQLKLLSGQWADALALAQQVLRVAPDNRYAQFFVGIDAFKRKQFGVADGHFEKAGKGPIAELTATLSRAWSQVARKRGKAGLLLVDTLSATQGSQYIVQYHRALIADATGQPEVARAAYDEAFRRNGRFARLVEAYARHLTRTEGVAAARTFLEPFLSGDQTHPLIKQVAATSQPLPVLVATSIDGLAEVFYGVGEALSGDGVAEDGQMFLQLALYARGDFDVARYALGEVYEQTKNWESANASYDLIPATSALRSNALIRKAFNLNQLKNADEAKTLLQDMIRAAPADIAPRYALANVLRANKSYLDAIPHLTAIIDKLKAPRKSDWVYYYARGICYERTKQWPLAEADLKQAIALDPAQDQALNYLGYSWVDQGMKLDEGMVLIQKAVQLKPNSGFIVDSLGWAYYRIGNFDQAVKYLERAVELQPEDPTLNDHLGDAYYRVGRKLEAKYQWSQALTLKPEVEDETRIRQKVESGSLGAEATRADAGGTVGGAR